MTVSKIEEVAKAISEAIPFGVDQADAAKAARAAIEAMRVPTEEMVEAGGSEIIRPSVYMGGTPPGAKRRARDVWAAMFGAIA